MLRLGKDHMISGTYLRVGRPSQNDFHAQSFTFGQLWDSSIQVRTLKKRVPWRTFETFMKVDDRYGPGAAETSNQIFHADLDLRRLTKKHAQTVVDDRSNVIPYTQTVIEARDTLAARVARHLSCEQYERFVLAMDER